MRLSNQVVAFLAEEAMSPFGARRCAPLDLPSDTNGLVEALKGDWDGVLIPGYGGNYFGWTRIAVSGRGWVTSPDGDEFIRIAENEQAPCAIVLHRDGRVGVSWSGEYTDMFSGLPEFLSLLAVWSEAKGWVAVRVAARPVCEVVAQAAGGRTAVDTGGSLTRWTSFGDLIVIEEPLLSGFPEDDPVVHVLIGGRDIPAAPGASEYGPYAQEIVGHGFPGIPPRWIISE